MKGHTKFNLFLLLLPALAANQPPDGWQANSPRDEIRPQFSYEPKGGPDRKGSFVITADTREGLAGWWAQTFGVQGGQSYRRSQQANDEIRTAAAPQSNDRPSPRLFGNE